jgi:copper chaperone NosL
MKNYKLLILLACSAVYLSCSTDPAPIQYGSDQCNFCKMNIVDKAHAAQYVSLKGKQFKYDAIECLIREIVRNDITDMAHTLVADYSNPGKMIDAEGAFYIISSNIKSPMGANLSAVSDEKRAGEIIKELGGQIYDWTTVKPQIEKQH